MFLFRQLMARVEKKVQVKAVFHLSYNTHSAVEYIDSIRQTGRNTSARFHPVSQLNGVTY